MLSCSVHRFLLCKMAKSLRLYHAAVIFLTCCISLQACADNLHCKDVRSISGMMLRGHVFQEHNAANILTCGQLCISNIRCQSVNYVISRHLCELNSRTKGARPKDYVEDADRVYLTRPIERGIELTLVLLAINERSLRPYWVEETKRKIEFDAVVVYFVYQAKGDLVMIDTRKEVRFVSLQGHPQPHCSLKAWQRSTEVSKGMQWRWTQPCKNDEMTVS